MTEASPSSRGAPGHERDTSAGDVIRLDSIASSSETSSAGGGTGSLPSGSASGAGRDDAPAHHDYGQPSIVDALSVSRHSRRSSSARLPRLTECEVEHMADLDNASTAGNAPPQSVHGDDSSLAERGLGIRFRAAGGANEDADDEDTASGRGSIEAMPSERGGDASSVHGGRLGSADGDERSIEAMPSERGASMHERLGSGDGGHLAYQTSETASNDTRDAVHSFADEELSRDLESAPLLLPPTPRASSRRAGEVSGEFLKPSFSFGSIDNRPPSIFEDYGKAMTHFICTVSDFPTMILAVVESNRLETVMDANRIHITFASLILVASFDRRGENRAASTDRRSGHGMASVDRDRVVSQSILSALLGIVSCVLSRDLVFGVVIFFASVVSAIVSMFAGRAIESILDGWELDCRDSCARGCSGFLCCLIMFEVQHLFFR